MDPRPWNELSSWTRRWVVVAGLVQVGLLVLAQVDLARRPADLVRGSKAGWRWATLINVVGPLGYLLCGRRRRYDP